jgi:hypothetical protein
MCPARARGLAKRRAQSLHVFFAMARELSAGRSKIGEEREKWSESRRESCGGVRI